MTPPTVLMEAVFITVIVDVYKECNIACFDITGAFLHAHSYKDISMIMKGRLAELMMHGTPNLYRSTYQWTGRGWPHSMSRCRKPNMGKDCC
jgi:hypothetical protein